MEFDRTHSVAQIHERCPGILLDHAVGLFRHCDRPHAGGNFDRLVTCASQIKVSLPGWGLRIVAIPGLLPRSQQLLDIRRDRATFFPHALHRGFDSGRIPQRKWPQFPIEPQPHRPIDLHHGIRNLRNPIGGIGPQIGQSRPQELPRLVSFLRRTRPRSRAACAPAPRGHPHFSPSPGPETWASAADDIRAFSNRAPAVLLPCRRRPAPSCKTRRRFCPPATAARASGEQNQAAPGSPRTPARRRTPPCSRPPARQYPAPPNRSSETFLTAASPRPARSIRPLLRRSNPFPASAA